MIKGDLFCLYFRFADDGWYLFCNFGDDGWIFFVGGIKI